MNQYWYSLLVSLLILLPAPVPINGYGQGAPAGVCTTMLPGHGQDPQPLGSSPYTINIGKAEVLGGESVKIVLSVTDRSKPFIGFLVQGQKQSTNYGFVREPLGNFKKSSRSDIHPINCQGVTSSGMTHSDNSPKTEIELEWIAPNEEGTYVLLASFVQSYETYWIKQPSGPIRVRKNTQIVDTGVSSAPKLSAEAESILNSYYDGCGSTKGCFGLPNGCISSKNCDMFTTFRVDGNKYAFQVSGSIPAESTKGYVASGLSFDRSMGNDSVIACVINPSNNGEVEVYSYFTDGKAIGFLRDAFTGLVPLTQAFPKTRFLDSRIFCEFSRVPRVRIEEREGVEFDLDNEGYYILMAKGTGESPERLNYHGGFKGVSETKLSLKSPKTETHHRPTKKPAAAAPVPPPKTLDPNPKLKSSETSSAKSYESIYENCGVTKGCFGMPLNCIDSKTCDTIVSFDAEYNFQLSGKLIDSQGSPATMGHVSLGLSFDQKMGDDSVIACTLNNGKIETKSYYNNGYSNKIFSDPRLGLETSANEAKNSFVDGYLYCEFKRSKDLVSEEITSGTEFHLDTDKYYLLLAKAGSLKEDGGLQYHNSDRLAAPDIVSLADSVIVGGPLLQKYYSGCGKRKGCFGLPAKCVSTQDCDILVTYNGDLQFELTGKLNSSEGHVSVGLSFDEKMAQDLVTGCTLKDDKVEVQSYYNVLGRHNNLVMSDPKAGLVSSQGRFEDGRIYCEFTRESLLESPELELNVTFNLKTDEYHILLAKAEQVTIEENGDLKLGRHTTEDRIASSTSILLNDTSVLGETIDNVYSGCTSTKGCFGLPNGCVQTENCELFVSFDKYYNFQVVGKVDNANGVAHVSTGLSFDDKMGGDHVIGCVLENGQIRPKSYYNPPNAKKNYASSIESAGLDGQGSGKYLDGQLFCEFKRTEMLKDTNNEVGGDIDLLNGKFHLLLARASSLGASGLGYHELETDRGVTPDAVHMTYIGVLGSRSNILTQLHGGFMIIAWLLCASTGMFTARYYKQTHTDFNPFNKAFWFMLHITCMFTTVFLTICGIIFIFIEVGGYSEVKEGAGKAHPILGLILLGLAVMQVTIAFFRPHPGTSMRPLFNWVHWSIGNSAHIVGIACIFLAPELPKAGLKESFWYPLVAFVIFHVGMHIVMSLHTIWADKQMNTQNKMRAVHPGPMKPSGKAEEAPGAGFRTFMLTLYLFCAALVAIILVLCVAKAI